MNHSGKMLVGQSKVYYLWETISKRIRWTGLTGTEIDGHEVAARETMFQELLDSILAASLPTDMSATGSYAVDAVAIDSFGLARSGLDYDAQWGYRTKTDRNRTDQVYGYKVTPLLRVPKVGQEYPMLTERFFIIPANGDEAPRVTGMCQSLIAAGTKITEIIADRAYSNYTPDRFADPLREMNIRQVVDIRPEQHGASDYCGALMIDGQPHCPQTPEHLRVITKPAYCTKDKPTKNDTAKDRARKSRNNEAIDQFHANIAEREKYAFQLNATTKTGQQFICPAKSGKVRCTGCPLSLGAPDDLPLLENPPAEPGRACTQRTILVPWSVDPKIRQHHRWGSPEWCASFGRRSRVEGLFGMLQGAGSGSVNSNWIRVVGLVNTGIMIAIALVAANLDAMERWLTEYPNQDIDADFAIVSRHVEFEEVPLSGLPPAPPGSTP